MRFREHNEEVPSANAALDFFIAPVSLWALFAVAAGFLVEDRPTWGTRFMVAFILFAMAALGFEVGFKRYYAQGRRRYFYFIFVPPALLTLAVFVGSFVPR